MSLPEHRWDTDAVPQTAEGGLGTPWGGLGTPWGGLGTPWGGLGTPWGGLGTPWGGLGTPWGGLGTPRGGGTGHLGRRKPGTWRRSRAWGAVGGGCGSACGRG